MVYRQPAGTIASDTAAACMRCGTLASFSFATRHDGRFACSRCGLEQPTLRRAEDLDVETMTLVDYAIGSYEQLRPFLRERFANDVQCAGFDVMCDGIPCKVGLNINSGSVMGLDLAAPANGLPHIRFVGEDDSHVLAKEGGVVREVQTGDAEFDREVYVESSATDDDVLTVLASPAVRAAIRRLLADATHVTIGANVTAYVQKGRDAFDPEKLGLRLAWLRIVAGAPRPHVTQYVPEPMRASLTKTVVYLAAPFSVLFMILALARWAPLAAGPYFFAIGSGVVLAVLLAPVYTVLLRGRSTSHRDIMMMRVTTFVFAPMFALALLVFVNGAFDSSAERLVTMKAVKVEKDDEDDTLHYATTVDASGGVHRYPFHGTGLAVGTPIQVGWRDGALGWTWESAEAVVLQGEVR